MEATTVVIADAAQTVLDYIDVLVYPTLIFVLLGGFLLLFRTQIAQFILRLREARFPGGSLHAAPEKQDAKDVAPLRKEIESAAEGQPAQSDDIAALRTAYESLETQAHMLKAGLLYERVYRTIFGSQIRLLQGLEFVRQRSDVPPGMAEWEVEGYYRPHAPLVGASPFPQWLGYLLLAGLVQMMDNRYHITDLGQGFLLYLIRMGIPAWKPL